MTDKPGMFSDWSDMIATVGLWLALSFFSLWLFVILGVVIWSLI